MACNVLRYSRDSLPCSCGSFHSQVRYRILEGNELKLNSFGWFKQFQPFSSKGVWGKNRVCRCSDVSALFVLVLSFCDRYFMMSVTGFSRKMKLILLWWTRNITLTHSIEMRRHSSGCVGKPASAVTSSQGEVPFRDLSQNDMRF